MEAWILIWTLIYGSDGVATHSQEFSSKANCQFAMLRVVSTNDRGTLIIGCYPK